MTLTLEEPVSCLTIWGDTYVKIHTIWGDTFVKICRDIAKQIFNFSGTQLCNEVDRPRV